MSYRYRENSPGRRRRSRSPIGGGSSYNGGRSNGYEMQRNGGGYGDRNGNGYSGDRSNGYDRDRNNGYYDRERGSDRYGGAASRRRSRSRDRYGGGDEDDMCRLHVGDLNERVTQDDLERAFSRYGEIKEVWMARNPPSFAFIVFRDARDAAAALRDMDAR